MQTETALPDYAAKVKRHRARRAVMLAGLPLWRKLVDEAERSIAKGNDIATAARVLRLNTPRLPQ